MNAIQLKVCGLTKLDQINTLISLKIDFLGFIFYHKSPRYVLNHLNLVEINSIDHKGKIGVFLNEKISKIIEITEKANLNFVQLHGDETDCYISELRDLLDEKIGIIKVFRMGNSTEGLESRIKSLKLNIDFFLFDTDSASFGGTGTTFNWQILDDLRIQKPYYLSGGISLENVENLKDLKQKPFSIDINSKFEIEPGNKDLEKIKTLIHKLKL